jgi:hypothetical protein
MERIYRQLIFFSVSVCRIIRLGDFGNKNLQFHAPVSLILIQVIGISKKSFTFLFGMLIGLIGLIGLIELMVRSS